MQNFSPTFLYGLYALTIFISSFLLFQIQPLISKHILPWFGGSSSVWMTALFFFTVTLAIGYLYVLLIARFRTAFQVCIHLTVLLIVLGITSVHAEMWPSAITPPFITSFLSGYGTGVSTLLVLTLSVGAPFVLLASTSSLIQLWYAKTSGGEPFSLYAISNIGSLLGLVSYPVFFEPLFTTIFQGKLWSFGFTLYCVCMVIVMLHVTLSKHVVNQSAIASADADPEKTRGRRRQFFIWTGVAMVPVMTMLMGTTYLTTIIAPIPLLWVIPLALYLVSFIVSFQERFRIPFMVSSSGTLLLTGGTLSVLSVSTVNPFIQVAIVLASMFAIFHLCHEYLYDARPNVSRLTHFYVAIAVGGGLGGFFTLLTSLYVLRAPIEFVILLTNIALVTAYITYFKTELGTFCSTRQRTWLWRGTVGIVCVNLLFVSYEFLTSPLYTDRNFFGYKAVSEYEVGSDIGTQRTLTHGHTQHGSQLRTPGKELTPITYYSLSSGIGSAFADIQMRHSNTSIRVGTIGLGAGSIAAYCRAGDEFVFYEIDPQVIEIAESYFSYLTHCAGARVEVGDGRLLLTEALLNDGEEYFDVIIIDAYADDMVPVHLMTNEAFALYRSMLRDDGVLIVHISSRYLELAPVLLGNAHTNNLTLQLRHDLETTPPATPSLWAVLTKDTSGVDQYFADTFTTPLPTRVINWTDQYSAIVPVIRR